MAVALAALDAAVHLKGGGRSSGHSHAGSLYRLPATRPELDTWLGQGELITGIELPPAATARVDAM